MRNSINEGRVPRNIFQREFQRNIYQSGKKEQRWMSLDNCVQVDCKKVTGAAACGNHEQVQEACRWEDIDQAPTFLSDSPQIGDGDVGITSVRNVEDGMWRGRKLASRNADRGSG